MSNLRSKLLQMVPRPLMRQGIKWARRSGLIRFELDWSKHSYFPERINLSLSLLCPANCIYCPERGPEIQPKVMPVKLVRKILDEAEARGFKGGFSLSEMGEALTHPRFFEILHEIRSRFPDNDIVFFSNMVLMDRERAEKVLAERVNGIHFNLDGTSEETYRFVKGNRLFERVRQNALGFLHLRNEKRASCVVGIGFVSAKAFSEEIQGQSGVFPDDTTAVRSLFEPLLGPGDYWKRDEISLEKFRDALRRPKSEFCSMYPSILREAYVASNGQMYLCCRDFGIKSSLGNLNNQSMSSIWSGELRRQMVRNIFLMHFEQASKICRYCLPDPCCYTQQDLYLQARTQIQNLFQTKQLSIVDGRLIDAREIKAAR